MRRVAHPPRNKRSAFAGRAAAQAWVSLLTLLVVALAPLMAAFHQASARHVRCEHGDLIEPEQAHDLEINDGPTSRRVGAGQRQLIAEIEAASSASMREHRHCAVASLARTAATSVACPAVVAAAPPAVVGAHPGASQVAAPKVLVSAPKTSPPCA